MNRHFKLKNPIVENILSQRCKLPEEEVLNENLTQLLSLALNPLSTLIQSLLSGERTEEAEKFETPDGGQINPENLQIDAPKVRYESPPGLQLSRASTIA